MRRPGTVPAIVATLSVFLLAGFASAGEQEAPGSPGSAVLTPGEPPPSGFELQDLDGEVHRLSDVLGSRPILLVFFRGAW